MAPSGCLQHPRVAVHPAAAEACLRLATQKLLRDRAQFFESLFAQPSQLAPKGQALELEDAEDCGRRNRELLRVCIDQLFADVFQKTCDVEAAFVLRERVFKNHTHAVLSLQPLDQRRIRSRRSAGLQPIRARRLLPRHQHRLQKQRRAPSARILSACRRLFPLQCPEPQEACLQTRFLESAPSSAVNLNGALVHGIRIQIQVQHRILELPLRPILRFATYESHLASCRESVFH